MWVEEWQRGINVDVCGPGNVWLHDSGCALHKKVNEQKTTALIMNEQEHEEWEENERKEEERERKGVLLAFIWASVVC